MVATRWPEELARMMLFEPMPLIHTAEPSVFHAMPRGSATDMSCSACVTLVLRNCGLGGFRNRCGLRSATPPIAPMLAGSKLAMRWRTLLCALWKKRCSFGPYVPTTYTRPFAGLIVIAALMLSRFFAYVTERFDVWIIATSFSFRFHVTSASQMWLLSSFQLTPSLLMISDVVGGAGRPPAIGGLNVAPLFGGGLAPPYGPEGSETMLSGRIIERLPDSKIAA